LAKSRSTLWLSLLVIHCTAATLALAQSSRPTTDLPTQPPGASPLELRVLGGSTDYSIVHPRRASPQELPTWRIPNIPQSAEAYYAPDNYHIIAQTQDPDGAHARATT
jgi:hypothetical protein